MTSWADVRHQAQRCRRLQNPEDRKKAGQLWFVLVRQVLEESNRTQAMIDQVVPCEDGDEPRRRNGR